MSILDLFFYLTFLNWSIVSLLWLYYKKTSQLSLIFTYWGVGIALMTWTSMIIEAALEDPSLNLRQLIANILISIWAIRLSIHISKRKFWITEDPRYTMLKKKIIKQSSLQGYTRIFLPFCFLQLVIMSPIISLNFLPGPKSFNFFDLLGFLIFIGGYVLETRADGALIKFRQQPGNESKVLKTGLWKYTRHPNYLGDILQWWGIYLLASNAVGGIWSFYSPLIMTLFFLKISINTLEKGELIKRKSYKKYIQTTNKLFPHVKILGYIQYLIPHKLLTFIFGYFCKSRNQFLKTILLRIFCLIYKPNLKEAQRETLKEYKSFNDFFSRKLKPNTRIVDHSESKVVSPVDGIVKSFGKINNGKLLQAKGINYKLADLLKDKNLEKLFQEGFYVTIYLAPPNYHRIHFPLEGTIKQTKHFEGTLYSVNKSSQQTVSSLYTKNERTLIHVKSGKSSYILISVGASMVGSIIPFWLKGSALKRKKLSEAWNKGPPLNLMNIKKGQEAGYFEMGSTVIMLFPKFFKFNNNFLSESKAVKFGEVLIDLTDY